MLYRIQPNMPPELYQTYQILRPRTTHSRQATCEEVGCGAFLNGWRTILPVGSDLIDVLKRSGRAYKETKIDGNLVEFTFAPGQICFKSSTHRVSIDRPAIYRVTGGDWRGNPRNVAPRVHRNVEDWVDDFGEHQEKVIEGMIKHG